MFSSHDNNKRESSHVDIDDAISENFRQLERLAAFYHQRGDLKRAAELAEAIEKFRMQAANREAREALRKQSDQADSNDQQKAG